MWENGESVEDCRKELVEMLEEWIVLKIRDNDPLPVVEGITIKVRQEAVA